MLPTIKKTMKQAQEAFSKVDTKVMTNKLHQAVNFMKKKMQDLKKSSENNEISIKVNNKDAQKQIPQVQKQIDSLQEKINARQMKLNVINPQIDKIVDDTRKSVTPEGINPNDKAMDTTVNNALGNNKDFTALNNQAQKLYTEIEMYNKQLSEAKNKMTQLKQEINRTAISQGKLTSFFSGFKQKIDQVKPSISKMKDSFKGLPKITQNITNNIKGMGTGLKNGLGHVLKYAMALFSLRGIYSILSGCANAWLSSQNAGAKQLSENINYMKYAMGSALAPVIQFVTNLVYQLMKAIQSVAYALTGVNIFAKASASSYTSMAGSAKKAKNETKQLAGIHDEINNVQSNDNSSSGSSGSTSPSFDLSGIDNQMSPFAQKLFDFFRPLVDSWNKYGSTLVEQIKTTVGQVTSLISAVWGSFEKIITNGTVYKSLELILAIIGNIAEAFANAWNYNGNGDAIVQSLANAFNNLLTAINNVVQSEGFQNWLNDCSEKFKVISEKISEINWQPLIDALFSIGESIGTVALDVLSGLVDVFKWVAENPNVIEVLTGIAIAIKLISVAVGIWNTVQMVWNALMSPVTLTIMLIVGAIVALIAIVMAVIEVIKNWGTISEWLSNKFTEAKEAITKAFQNIGKWFADRWNDICNAFSNVGKWFSDTFNSAVQGIKNAFSSVGAFFKGVWQGICNVFGNVANWFGNIFGKAWQAVKNVFSSGGRVFDGIKEGILNGLKAIVNAIINGINKVVAIPFNGLNAALRAIKNVNIMGLSPFGWISTISVPQIPRLAKGGVLTEATTVLAGEYSGAKTNPEIVTPQNIMRDTFEDVLSDFNNNNGQPLHVTIQYLGREIFDDTIDYINSKTRRTGKNTIVTVGD